MSQKKIPQEMLIITTLSETVGKSKQQRRGSLASSTATKLLNAQSVDITSLQGQVNIFLQQMSVVMEKTPEKVGEFKLDQLEVSAAITLQAEGEVKLALIASGKVGAGMNAGLKFVFKRS